MRCARGRGSEAQRAGNGSVSQPILGIDAAVDLPRSQRGLCAPCLQPDRRRQPAVAHLPETRNVHGRTILASNSVLFVASASAHGAARLDTFASDLVAHGCAIHAQSAERVALFRFETFVTPLLVAASAAIDRTGLAVSATMAVKVLVEGRQRPSPKSVDIGTTLAHEASPGQLVLSLHLASLLQATETECAGLLHTATVRMANGRERAVVTFNAATASGPASRGGMGQVMGRLSKELFERLVYRIYQRIHAAAPGVNEQVVRQAVKAGDSAVAIAQALLCHVPRESHAAVRLIVDDEVRWIRVRREPSGVGNA
jgi:hypothetical protein